MTGTIVNAVAISTGGLVGWLAGGLLSDKIRGTLLTALGLVVLGLGMENLLGWGETLPQVIIALVVGGIIGEVLDVEGWLEALGNRVQRAMGRHMKGNFAKGFVYTTLIYCVGAMAILGSIESGLEGTHRILLAKASIDGLTAVAFASALGPGVIFSAVPVLIYQGLLTLGAGLIAPVIELAETQLSATGGVLIMGLGIKILEIKQIRVANLLPALPVVVLLAWVFRG